MSDFPLKADIKLPSFSYLAVIIYFVIGLDPFVEKCGDYTVPRRKEIKRIAAASGSILLYRLKF